MQEIEDANNNKNNNNNNKTKPIAYPYNKPELKEEITKLM
jgi:hypothetical protein